MKNLTSPKIDYSTTNEKVSAFVLAGIASLEISQSRIKSSRIVFWLTSILLFYSFQPIFAQARFEKTYGSSKNEYGRYAIVTANHDYALTGYVSKNATNKEIYFLRLDSCGRKKISRIYGGTLDDVGNAIIENNVGNLVVAGNTKNFGSIGTNAYFMKLSGATFGTAMGRAVGDTFEDFGEYIRQTSDLGYIIVGSTNSKGAGNSDVMLVKLNATGNLSWAKTYGGTQDDYGYSVRQISNGYIITGSTKSFGMGNSDVYLIKTDLNGNVIWSKTYGNTSGDIAFDVKQTLDGGFILAGKTRNSNPAGNSMDDILLLKITSLGNLQWAKSYGGLQDETGESVVQLYDSSYVVAGYTKSFGHGNWDAYLFKVNKNGITIWARTFGGVGEDKVFSMESAPYNSGFLLCGHTNSFGAGGFDVYLVKTDFQGFTGCNDTSAINTYTPIDSVKSGVQVDSNLNSFNGAHADTITAIDSVVCSNCNPPLNHDQQDVSDWNDEAIVYPVPADDYITLQLPSEFEEPVAISIFNEVGQLVFLEENIQPSGGAIQINTQKFVGGIYAMKISAKQVSFTRKILIVK